MFTIMLALLMLPGNEHYVHALDFKVVDLTHLQDSSTIYWPGNPAFNFTIIFRNRTSTGYWYESNSFQTAEHGGTHLDAPAHFAEGTERQHQIPMERLVGPGVVINVKSKVSKDSDYRVATDDLTGWEAKHGRIPNGSVVMMNSGWSTKYPNKTLTFGTQTPNDPSTFHFPGWHEDTIKWLINNRNVHVVGVDTPSTDYARSTTFQVHVLLGKAGIAGAENVANLDLIPESGSIIYVAAIKLYDGSGGPARVFSTFAHDGMVGSSPPMMGSVNFVLIFIALLTHNVFMY